MNHNQMINIAKSQLGMDDDTYRAMLVKVTGKASLRLMNVPEKNKVLSNLKNAGFRVNAGGKRKKAPKAAIRYCHVLWGKLHAAGHAKTGGAKGLNLFVRHQFQKKWGHAPIDVDALTDSAQINDVVEALKAWCRRENIATEQGADRG